MIQIKENQQRAISISESLKTLELEKGRQVKLIRCHGNRIAKIQDKLRKEGVLNLFNSQTHHFFDLINDCHNEIGLINEAIKVINEDSVIGDCLV